MFMESTDSEGTTRGCVEHAATRTHDDSGVRHISQIILRLTPGTLNYTLVALNNDRCVWLRASHVTIPCG